jgi:hypothetical protein
MIPIRTLSRRLGKVVCVIEAYVDESYDRNTFCVGGWLAPRTTWTRLETQWEKRVEHERRMSIRKGFAPITRYHASYVANHRGEFADDNGWDDARRILFVKKLMDVLGRTKPDGIVIGGSVEHYKNQTGDAKHWRKGLYFFSFGQFIINAARVMHHKYPGEQCAIFYDDSKELGKVANEVFSSLKHDPANADIAPLFSTIAPMTGEDCVPLQSADFIAYDGKKCIASSLGGATTIRKSLQRVIGHDLTVIIGHYSEDKIREVVERKKAREAKAKANDQTKS